MDLPKTNIEIPMPPVKPARPSAPSRLLALSVRQPWAWLIVNGWKNIENREWASATSDPCYLSVPQQKGPTSCPHSPTPAP